jgi:site-specific DNA-methyltransferase (adenine-specific)
VTVSNIYSQYERIFERNGSGKYWAVLRAKKINNRVDAQMNRDVLTTHDSQKPQKIITQLLLWGSEENNLVLDPFLGSGTTCHCAKKLNRYSIGIEIEEKYCEIAAKRCSQEVMEFNL